MSDSTPGGRFARLRAARGFTQGTLAAALDPTSPRAATISDFESGKVTRMRPPRWEKVAKLFGMTLGQLDFEVFVGPAIFGDVSAAEQAVLGRRYKDLGDHAFWVIGSIGSLIKADPSLLYDVSDAEIELLARLLDDEQARRGRMHPTGRSSGPQAARVTPPKKAAARSTPTERDLPPAKKRR